jgi:hypothetical protein
MGSYDPNPVPDSDAPATTKEEAEARAGKDVGFRGTYGGNSGRAAQNWNIVEQQEREQEEQLRQSESRRVPDNQGGYVGGVTPTSGEPTAAELAGQSRRVGFSGATITDSKGKFVNEYIVNPETRKVTGLNETIASRPRYVPDEQFGDSETQRRVADLSGESKFNSLGGVIERQRQEAAKTPGIQDDMFYQNQLDLWNAQSIERSSGYHAFGKEAGIPVSANPFENEGDIALAFEKAGNQKDNFNANYAFNPNVGSVLQVLPQVRKTDGSLSPVGLQEYSWMGAIARDRNNPDVGAVSFLPAINYLNSQRGRQGVYGDLAGGVRDVFTPLPAGFANGGIIETPTQPFFSEATAKRPFASILAETPTESHGGLFLNPFVVSAASGGEGGMQFDMNEANAKMPFVSVRANNANAGMKSEWDRAVDIVTNDPLTIHSGGLIGRLFFGDKSEEVIAGAITSSISAATFGYVDLSSASGKIYDVSTKKEYKFGEFTKWGEGAGKQVRESLGFNEDQLIAYETNLNAKPVPKGIFDRAGYAAERLVFGTGKLLSTHPEEIISGYGAGAIWAAGGEVIGGGIGVVSAGAGRFAPLATHALSIMRSPVVNYGVPAALVGMTAYSATEGFTASASRSLVNIGGTLLPMGGMLAGGLSTQALLRSNRIGFGTEQKEIQVIDLRTVLDLRPEINLETGRSAFMRPDNVATLAEQRMVVTQFGLTSQEIRLAKMQGLSLNDILALRDLESQYAVTQTVRSPIVSPKMQFEEVMTINLQEQGVKQISGLYGNQVMIGSNLVSRLARAQNTYNPVDTAAFPVVDSIQSKMLINMQKVSPLEDTVLMTMPLQKTGLIDKSDYKRAFSTVSSSVTSASYKRVLDTVAPIKSADYNRVFDKVAPIPPLPPPGKERYKRPFDPTPPYTPEPTGKVPPTTPVIPIIPFLPGGGGGSQQQFGFTITDKYLHLNKVAAMSKGKKPKFPKFKAPKGF